MKVTWSITFLFLLMMMSCSTNPPVAEVQPQQGRLEIITSSHSPFPHPARKDGHHYNDNFFSFEEHYNDSSVAIFIPPGFRLTESVDLVFYFHGWGNNIQKSLDKFDLLGQFSRGGRNAIFVFPEGPKNASDSYGGRLEEPNTFKFLVEDVTTFLSRKHLINTTQVGTITLSGHSGAYRVISKIIYRGGLTQNIHEVFLFDALYAAEEIYADWIQEPNSRFINITTPDGGTLDNSLGLEDSLSIRNVAFARWEKNMVSEDELAQNRVNLIYVTLGHSEVIDPYFEIFLRSK